MSRVPPDFCQQPKKSKSAKIPKFPARQYQQYQLETAIAKILEQPPSTPNGVRFLTAVEEARVTAPCDGPRMKGFGWDFLHMP